LAHGNNLGGRKKKRCAKNDGAKNRRGRPTTKALSKNAKNQTAKKRTSGDPRSWITVEKRTMTGVCAPGARNTSAHDRCDTSCVTSKKPLALAPRACTTRSGMRSRSKLAIFSTVVVWCLVGFGLFFCRFGGWALCVHCCVRGRGGGGVLFERKARGGKTSAAAAAGERGGQERARPLLLSTHPGGSPRAGWDRAPRPSASCCCSTRARRCWSSSGASRARAPTARAAVCRGVFWWGFWWVERCFKGRCSMGGGGGRTASKVSAAAGSGGGRRGSGRGPAESGGG
jgi:hypothetical protein